MKFIKVLALSLVLSTNFFSDIPAAEPPGQIAVSPSMFEIPIGAQPATRSIRLKNLKETPVTLKVEIYNWTLDGNNTLQESPPSPQSIDQWMVINPLAFTIAPGKEQVVRFSIRPRVQPEPGEHRAIIYFNEQPSSTTKGGVEMLFRLGVGIYAYAEPIVHKGTLTALTLDRNRKTIHAELMNRGNVHTRMKGSYAIWRKGTFPGFSSMAACVNLKPGEEKPEGFIRAGNLNNSPVLAGTQRSIATAIPIPDADPQNYVIAVQGTVDGATIEKLFQ
ncbi:MAG: hypothetical protein A3K90_05255 [Pelodictyon luteolum]|uniref:Pili assembly chaperone N-terminal domain-containing protein n=1 Tax=Pelodictyon luteolum TaxID=1100 RepID=A0A165LWW6_PELLU|nr:fimbria/pilus periplasmic chaperone [Pelodictyon luteolum]KZK74531.1 MAG: hypothetical protein A3K90_05255 [Pelodictyon luteolum]